MKHIEAKRLIIAAYSKVAGINLAPDTQIEHYLVLGVKIGQLTPEEAARKSHDEYVRKCNRAFERKESN